MNTWNVKISSDGDSQQGSDKNKDLNFKAKAKDLTFKAKAKAKNLSFKTKAKDLN